MKTLPIKKITIANLVLNVFFVLLFWSLLFSIRDFADKMIIHPNSFEFRTDECSGEKYVGPLGDSRFFINPEAMKNNPDLEQQVMKKFYLGRKLFHLIQLTILFFFLLYFKQFMSAIYQREVYNKKTLNIIKYLAYLIFAYAVQDFLSYQALGIYFPHSVIVTYYNYATVLDNFWYSLEHSVNLFYISFGLLFLMFSTVLKGAIELKEQSDLTI